MGIDTTFRGRFRLDGSLAPEHAAYLRNFARTRHVQRSTEGLEDRSDPLREAVGLPLGEEGGYFTGVAPLGEEQRDPSVVDANQPPAGQPGLWCQWTPTFDADGLEWNGEEKFYAFEEWLRYLIHHFLEPWGYHLSGAVEWETETDERGSLHVLANRIRARELPPLAPRERRARIARAVGLLEDDAPQARKLDALRDLASERHLVLVSEHWQELLPMLEGNAPAFRVVLCELLGRIVHELRRESTREVDRLEPLLPTIPRLLQIAQASDPDLTRAFVLLLGPFAMRLPEVAQLLTRALGSPDRMAAAFAARALGQHEADAIPVLLGALESDDLNTRCRAAEAFTWIGKHAGPALPFLRARLDSSTSERERRQLEHVLERLSSHP